MAKTATKKKAESGKATETLASSVYQQLFNDILNGKLKPGNKLRLQALKTEYNVGNSPLREALYRLSTNGMVIREENKGFRVSPASIAELNELIQTRCWLEERAIRESIKNADDEYDERIVLTFHRLSRVQPEDNGSYLSEEQETRHFDFHQALLAACNSDILLGYCAQLHAQTIRYRNLAAVVKYREGHENQEHKELRDAALARDADKAVTLLQAHYNVTAKIVIDRGSLE